MFNIVSKKTSCVYVKTKNFSFFVENTFIAKILYILKICVTLNCFERTCLDDISEQTNREGINRNGL